MWEGGSKKLYVEENGKFKKGGSGTKITFVHNSKVNPWYCVDSA